MLTCGSAFSLSRIRVSTDAMEMEIAMTADGAAPPSMATKARWLPWLLQRWCDGGGASLLQVGSGRRGGLRRMVREWWRHCCSCD